MASTYQIERDRGTQESRQQLAVLREKWPLAFPAKDQDVCPLAIGSASQIAGAMGWSLPYTLGVLGKWKMGPAYCQAVLRHDQRIALDGSPAETVDAEAKDMATKQLARMQARAAAKKAAAPAAVAPKPASARHLRRESNCAAECARRYCAEGRSRVGGGDLSNTISPSISGYPHRRRLWDPAVQFGPEMLNSPCRPCHRQAYRGRHFPSSAFRQPSLPW
jgi:sRNA-binding protein